MKDKGLSYSLIHIKSRPYQKIIFFFENMVLLRKGKIGMEFKEEKFILKRIDIYIYRFIIIY